MPRSEVHTCEQACHEVDVAEEARSKVLHGNRKFTRVQHKMIWETATEQLLRPLAACFAAMLLLLLYAVTEWHPWMSWRICCQQV